MNKSVRNKNFLVASAITIAFACLVLLLFHSSNSPLGSFFDVFIVLIVTHYVAIGFGVVVMVLRFGKVIRNNGLLLYLLAGVLNLFLGFAGIALFYFESANMEWLHQSILNLFIGFIILADSFAFSSEVKN